MRRLLALLAALLLLLGAAACSEDEDPAPAPDTTEEDRAAEDEGSTSDEDEPAEDAEDEDAEDEDAEAGDADRDAFVEAIATGLQEQDDEFPGTEEEITCIAEAMVDAVGLDGFEEAGITPEDFTPEGDPPLDEVIGPDEAEAIGGAMVSCFDDPVAVFADEFAAGDEDLQACLEQELDEEMLTTLFVALFSTMGAEDEEPPAEVLEMMLALEEACPGIL